MFVVFTRVPGGLIVGDSGLCCRVPCLSSAFIFVCLLRLYRRSRPHSVSDYNLSFILRSPEVALCGRHDVTIQ